MMNKAPPNKCPDGGLRTDTRYYKNIQPLDIYILKRYVVQMILVIKTESKNSLYRFFANRSSNKYNPVVAKKIKKPT
jgi:hypothetical protein